MKKNQLFIRRSFAFGMMMSLVVTLIPSTVGLQFSGKVVTVKAADSTDPADCNKVSDTISGKMNILYEEPDGNGSKDGVQKVKVVDAAGRRVDEKVYINEEYVESGKAAQYVMNQASAEDKKPESGFNGSVSGSLPAQYTSPYLTKSATNQGSWGVCWAFGCTAAMEANIVKGGSSFGGLNVDAKTVDLSERYLAWFTHNTFATDKTDVAYGDGRKFNTPAKAFKGGNEIEVAYALATGTGPELESTAKYDTSSAMKGVPENLRNFSVAKLRDTNTLSTYDYSEANVKTVKAMIKNYGATTVTYQSAEYGSDSSGATNCYTGVRGSNHMVSIVGWDDSYAASNFKKTPEGNGAWLCRNSWSSTWGTGSKKDGYFWMSYYQPTYNITAFDMQGADAYGKAYYYVRDAWRTYMSPGGDGNSTTAANVFQADGAETLKSVGVQAVANGMKAEVTIYTNSSPMSSPTDGTKKNTTTVEDIGLTGYHQIDLTQAVDLSAGQYFSVIIKLTGKTNVAMMTFEVNGAGTEKKGQTYLYDPRNKSWVDSTSKSLNFMKNAAIYAYTNPKTTAQSDLNAEIKAASALKQAEVTAMAGEETWKRIQMELAIARKAAQAQTVKRSVCMLQSATSTVSSHNLYSDAALTDGPGKNGVELYANGGTVKVNGVSINYKTRSLYSNFERTYSWVKSGKQYVGKVSGKYVAAVTMTKTKPELDVDGRIKTPDTAAQAIATASISGSKVTIKPKTEGDVYVWVLWYPKCSSGFNQQERLDAQKEYAMTKVHVSTAPAVVRLYANASDDPVNAAVNYTSVTMPAGGNAAVYVKGTVGSITKTANTMRVIDNEEIAYNCTVPAKYAPYITVTKDASNPQLFRIQTATNILDALNIKDGGKLTVTLPIVCDKNGKKANFKLVIGNPVKTVALSAGDAGTNFSFDNTTKVATVTMDSAKAAAQTAQIKETTTLYNADKKGTDTTSIIKIPCADGFTYSTTNGIKADGKISAAQSKVSLAAVKKEPGIYKITAAKGTPGGTEAYFALVHNAYGRTKGNGFQIIKVKVGEANHVVKTTVEKAVEDTVVSTGSDKIAAVTMGADTTKATTAQIRENITLADPSKEGTNSTTVFRMPSADAFTVTTAKEVTVTDALSAQQKKISIAAVPKKAGEYKITAAKGIQPGTEVYFMLFHNSESGTSGTGYQIIKVTAGEANHVRQITVKGSNGATVSTDKNKIATIVMTSNQKAAVTAEIAETVTLQNPAKEGTDISKIYRLPAADAFQVTKSKEIQVVGTLTSQQKKVSLAAVRGKTGEYKITAARGVLPGTEVYFMLFYNTDMGASGTGYQIVKVVIQ